MRTRVNGFLWKNRRWSKWLNRINWLGELVQQIWKPISSSIENFLTLSLKTKYVGLNVIRGEGMARNGIVMLGP